MSKKNTLVLAVTFLAVAGFYAYLYKDSFGKENIQISHTIRPNPRAFARPAANAADEGPLNVITFGLGNDYRLTSVKVISVAELATNRFPHPLWELLSDAGSSPLQAFSYGTDIPGMHPSVNEAQPADLAVNTPYRLVVEAGRLKGHHDFTLNEMNRVAR